MDTNKTLPIPGMAEKSAFTTTLKKQKKLISWGVKVSNKSHGLVLRSLITNETLQDLPKVGN